MNSGYRQCKACLAILPLAEFPRDRRAKGGYRSICRKCRLAKDRARRSRNVDKRRRVHTEWRKANPGHLTRYRLERGLTPQGMWESFIGHRRSGPNMVTISREDFLTWLGTQKRVCHYCGTKECDVGRVNEAFGIRRVSRRLEVDRRDNERAYEQGNLVLACHVCNVHKRDFFTEQEFLEIANEFVKPRMRRLLRVRRV
jgi:hypothetical protein